MLKEFKKFISQGNVMDLAVAVVIGAAFTAIVTSLVKDVITPFIGLVFGTKDFVNLTILGSVNIGAFINAIINFVIIAFVVFLIVQALNKLKDVRKAEEAEEEAEEAAPEIELLTEIRDLLKASKD